MYVVKNVLEIVGR